MGVKIQTEREMRSVASGRKGKKQEIRVDHRLMRCCLSRNATSVIIVT